MDILHRLSSDRDYTHLDLKETDVTPELLQAIADKLQINNFVCRVSWREGYYYNNNLKQKIEEKVEQNYNNLECYPNHYVNALLSKHVYYDSEEGGTVEFRMMNGRKYFEAWNKDLRSWHVHKVFNHPKAGGYYSVSYLNVNKKQIVLAHRGTKFEFWDLCKKNSSIKTDLEGVLGGNIVEQQKMAFKVTQEVINHAKLKGYYVSFTGHSLGAWLAEICLYFTVNFFGYFHSKAVTFDGPGSSLAIQSFKPNLESHETNQVTRCLDITSYVSAPNIVNCCHPHIGKMYRIFPHITIANYTEKVNRKLKKLKIEKPIGPYLRGLFSVMGHSMTPIVETFDAGTGKPVKFQKVLDWPRIKYKATTIDTIGTVICETPNSKPVLNFLSDTSRWAYGAFSKPTVLAILEVIVQFFKGNINCQQLWSVYQHPDLNAMLGCPLEDTSPLSAEEEQFDLLIEGHLRTREFAPSKDVYNPKSNDWYLKKLHTLSIDDIDQKKIDGTIKQKLKKLKSKYKIEYEDNFNYVKVLSGTEVDTVRDEMVKLLEIYAETKKILQDKTAHSPQDMLIYQLPKLTGDLPKCSDNIEERPHVLYEIGKFLGRYRRIVICASDGTGKSTIVQEYGCSLIKNFSNSIVRFIVANSPAKINDAYRSIAENEFAISVARKKAKNIMQLVHWNIAEAKTPVLFIFENVESFKDVKDYIDGIYEIDGCKVIITTGNKNVSKDLNLQNYEYTLSQFTCKESESYLGNNLAKNRCSQQETKYLIYKLGTAYSENLHEESFVLPYTLSKAVVCFNKNESCTADHYIENWKKSGDPTGTCLLFNLFKMPKYSFNVLQYSAYLDPDFISIDIIKELLSTDESTINNVLHELESLSLIKLKSLKYGQDGLQLHRLVQKSVKEYANVNKHLEIVKDEQFIYENIIQVLNRLFPSIKEIPDESWQISGILYPHAVNILQNNICCNKQAEISELNVKLGNHSYTVACDYSQACVYYDQALALDRKLYQDQDFVFNFTELSGIPIHPHIAIILNNFGKALHQSGKRPEGLKFEQTMLKRRRESQTSQNHSGTVTTSLSHTLASTSFSNPSAAFTELCEKSEEFIYDKERIEKERNEKERGLRFLEESLNIRRSLHSGQNHPDVAASLYDLGVMCIEQGHREKGIRHLEDALRMNRELYRGEPHPDIADCSYYLGITLLR